MWWNNAIIYQIYPRSFKDSNGDGIGDINGIISKLDYLNDGTQNSLGIDAIWISPMYKSPMKDYGYDVSDYYQIDPIFGSMDEFNRLIEQAHKRNIKVIMDFIPNHTSDQHLWFKQSRSSKNNPKRSWYMWHDPSPDGSPPNNWISVFGGSAWTLDKKTNQYYLHSFLPEQPDLNWRNPEVVKEMHNVLRFWLDRGVDGFRIDAFNHLFEDQKLRNEPQNPIAASFDLSYNSLLHTYTQQQSELIPTVNNFCKVLSAYGDRFMISEMYINLDNLIKFHKACPHSFHIPSNFNLFMPWRKASKIKSFIDKYDAALSPDGVPNYVLGNHDIERVVTRLGKAQARVGAILLLTLRCMPFIYYGEELGMENTHIPKGKICDPCGRQDPLKGRDPERTPMQWDSTPYAGFSTHEPWLPVNHNFGEYNVKSESQNPQSMLNLYRRLIWYRKQSPALLQGTYKSLDIKSRHVFAYMREHKNHKVLVVLNFSHKKHSAKLPRDIESGRVALNTHMVKMGEEISLSDLILRPNEGLVLEL